MVLTSAKSSANSGIYSTSRMVYGLAQEGDAPARFGNLSRRKFRRTHCSSRVQAGLPPGSALTVTCLPHHGVKPTLETSVRLRSLGYGGAAPRRPEPHGPGAARRHPQGVRGCRNH